MGDGGSDGTETHPSVVLYALKHALFVLSLDCLPWRTVCSMSGGSYFSDRDVRVLIQSRDSVQGPGSYFLGLQSVF